MKKYLFIFCGLPFVGKTTLAKAISKKFNLPHIDLDMINRKRGNATYLFPESIS